MAGNADLLRQALANIDAEIASWAFGTAPAMPDASGGGSFRFEAYRREVMDRRKALLEALSIADGPCEVETRMPG